MKKKHTKQKRTEGGNKLYDKTKQKKTYKTEK